MNARERAKNRFMELVEENERLKRRLDSTVSPKFAIGETVWWITGKVAFSGSVLEVRTRKNSQVEHIEYDVLIDYEYVSEFAESVLHRTREDALRSNGLPDPKKTTEIINYF